MKKIKRIMSIFLAAVLFSSYSFVNVSAIESSPENYENLSDEKLNDLASNEEIAENAGHYDAEKDGICDNCKFLTDTLVIDSGFAGENIIWTLDENGNLYICGQGDISEYVSEKEVPWYNYKNEIVNLTVGKGVERLHGVSFKGYTNLESVFMSDTVLTIPASFENCTSLNSVDFSRSLLYVPSYCFAGCDKLRSVYIPSSVKAIHNSAFRNCTSLEDIDFETGYIKLGSYVFYGTAAYNNTENIKDGFLYIDNCLIEEVSAENGKLVLGPEITSIASLWYKTSADTEIAEITVCNPDCVFPDDSSAGLYGNVVLRGFTESSTQEYCEKFGLNFVPLCNCEDTLNIPETKGYCNGTVGFSEGEWCENCKIWVSGHNATGEFVHIDDNSDLICDFCRSSVDADVIAAGKCGETLSWRIAEDYTLHIDGTGNMYSFRESSSPWNAYSDKISAVIIADGITSIGDYAFYNCKSFDSIKLSTVLVSIGECAFYGCEKLCDINLPDTIFTVKEKAFYGCKSIKNIVLPESALKIENGILSECSLLESAEIKGNVRVIPASMFEGCESLVTIKCAQVITEIGEKAFYRCRKLSDFSLSSVLLMGNNAFSYCENLIKISLPRLEILPANAFFGCKNLSTVIFSADLKTIGPRAFMLCSSIENLVIPESVNAVKEGAFSCCEGLKEISFLNDNVSIYSEPTTFDGVSYTTIPVSTAVKANCASTADIYADIHKNEFIPFYEKDILTVELTNKPSKTYYLLGKASQFSKEGAVVTVTYKDGTFIALKNRFSADWKNADIGKNGTYSVAIVYREYEFLFEISVVESYVFNGVPESRCLGEIYCCKDEVTQICFIPSETKEYVFAFDSASILEISGDAAITEQGSVRFTKKMTYEKGMKYYFYIKPVSESNAVKISEIDDIYFVFRPDGTYEAKFCLTSGDIIIPSEHGSVPVTKISDIFISESLIYGAYIEDVEVSAGITDIGAGAFYGHKYDVLLPDTVINIGKNAFRNFSGEVNLPVSVSCISEGAFRNSSVRDVVLGQNIKEVGKEAFSECNVIESLTVLSDNINYGRNAFSFCRNLKNASFYNETVNFGEYMFRGCEALENVICSGNVSEIPEGVFYGCSSLLRADFISQTTDIGSFAFYGCMSLSEINFNENITVIQPWSFYGCEALQKIELPDSVTDIKEYAFFNCKGVTYLKFSDNLSVIGQSAFSYLSINSAVLPASTAFIGIGCFANCSKLTKVILPKSISSVAEHTFNNCISLKEVIAEGKITEVEASAFYNCNALTELNFWDEIENIGNYAFAQCDSIVSVPLKRADYIGRGAFRYCDSLKSVVLPMRYTYIGDEAFIYCSALLEAEVPESSTIGIKAFSGCSSLEKAVLSDNVIPGKDCFAYCDNLKELYILTYSELIYDVGALPEDIEIYGYAESRAEFFANEKGYNFNCIEGHSHIFTVTTVEPDKCFAYTKNVYICNCGYSYYQELHYTGSKHYYKDFTVDKKATCTEYGLKSRHCYCGKTRTDVTLIEPVGHTEVIDIPALVPTETGPGFTHQSHCSVCGETVVKREVITHEEYNIKISGDSVTAEKFTAATSENDGVNILITFELKNNLFMSNIDKTVIYKVGEVKLSESRLIYNGCEQKPYVIAKDSKGEPLALNVDYKLTYSADSVYPGKYSVRVDFVGNYSGTKTLYYVIFIDAVIPDVTSVTSDSITLDWKKGHADIVYRVYFVDDSGSIRKIADTRNNSYTVSELESGREYRFLVWAFVKDDNGNIYWGEKGETVVCETYSVSAVRRFVTILKKMIERIKYMLKLLLLIQ